MSENPDYFERKIISLHDDDDLTEAELIIKQTLRTPVRKLPLATFRQHEKQGGSDEGGDQLTNQSVGGVQRARQLADKNRRDTLPAVYGGLFLVAEYFTRSFDAIKGKFFEKVIAAEEPSHRVDVDRNLSNLPQYLLEPNLSWKALDYTRESMSEDEQERYSDISSLTLDLAKNHMQANADATLFLQREGALVFGEHRTSVVSGGTTARPSLMRKPRSLVKELAKSKDVVTIPNEIATKYDLAPNSYSLTELLKGIGVDDIHIHIGILFDEDRQPATWHKDPQRSTSHRLIEEFEEDFLGQETGYVRNVKIDSDDLRLDFEVPVSKGSSDSITVHLSFLYGDNYLNTLYTGSLNALGPDGTLDDFEDPTSLREIISDNEADDLWLGFSVAERENKVYEMSESGSNNAMQIADMILANSGLTRRLIDFRELVQAGDRDLIDDEMLSFAETLAETYDEQRDNQWAEWVFGDNAKQYLRDVALQVLLYDTISRPIFLRRFPEEGTDDSSEKLAEIRNTFEQYLFDLDSDTTKKENIYRIVRNMTQYEETGTSIPADNDDSIVWSQAPNKSQIGNLLDVRTPTRILDSMVDGTAGCEGGILVKQGDKYAVPAPIAARLGEFLRDLPEDVEDEETQDTFQSF
jgi:hypothetical protein